MRLALLTCLCLVLLAATIAQFFAPHIGRHTAANLTPETR